MSMSLPFPFPCFCSAARRALELVAEGLPFALLLATGAGGGGVSGSAAGDAGRGRRAAQAPCVLQLVLGLAGHRGGAAAIEGDVAPHDRLLVVGEAEARRMGGLRVHALEAE